VGPCVKFDVGVCLQRRRQARAASESGKKAKQRKDAVIQIAVDMCKSHVLALEWQAWKQETIEVSIVMAAMN